MFEADSGGKPCDPGITAEETSKLTAIPSEILKGNYLRSQTQGFRR
jgi:hypothetical protein